MAKVRPVYNAKKHYGKRGSEVNSHLIEFGDHHCTIYQRPDSKRSSFYFRMYLAGEKRHYRKSLGTSDIAHAKKLAIDSMFETVGKVNAGERVLTVSLGEVLRRYKLVLEDRKNVGDSIKGGLSYNTWKAHRYRLNHGIQFLQDTLCAGVERITDRRINSLDGKHWDGYLKWRLEKRKARNLTSKKKITSKDDRRDVVRDELLSIRKMFKYAKEQGLCNQKAIPVWTFDVEKDPPVRERMNPGDYMKFINVVRAFAADAKGEKETYNRLLLQHFVLVVANTAMRSGELFGLKNKFVQIDRTEGKCLIVIRPETSKVKRGREVTLHSSRGGKKDGSDINYLIRWLDEYQIHKDPNDYVFPLMTDGRAQSRDVYYDTYKQLRKRLEDKNLQYMDTYHLRHYYITMRLVDNWSAHSIAKVAGTSTREIDATYSHIQTSIVSSDMNKKRRLLEQQDHDG